MTTSFAIVNRQGNRRMTEGGMRSCGDPEVENILPGCSCYSGGGERSILGMSYVIGLLNTEIKS
jgi:hypothetical protein